MYALVINEFTQATDQICQQIAQLSQQIPELNKPLSPADISQRLTAHDCLILLAYVEGEVAGNFQIGIDANLGTGGIGDVVNSPVIIIRRIDRGDGKAQISRRLHFKYIPNRVALSQNHAGDGPVDFVGILAPSLIGIGLKIDILTERNGPKAVLFRLIRRELCPHKLGGKEEKRGKRKATLHDRW